MNRAWMALAGLVVVGVVALNYQTRLYDWPDGPIYVTEAAPLKASECRGWQSRAERRHMAGFPGSREAYEGFSRLQGACHPQDQDRGRAMIEASIAKGAGRFLVVEYVLALQAVGDTARAAAELPLAAEIMRFRIALNRRWSGWAPEAWDSLIPAAIAEIDIASTGGEWLPTQTRFDHLLARPPWVPDAEDRVFGRLTGVLQQIDRAEGLFQAYRAEYIGRYYGRLGRDFNLERAAKCGHPEAIRIFARLVIDGESRPAASVSAIPLVVWLDSRTANEGDLIRALARFGTLRPQERAREMLSIDDWISTHCGGLRERSAVIGDRDRAAR